MAEPYKDRFTVRQAVLIADREALEAFRREWKYHHPLQPMQFEYAGRAAVVASVGFYHGGDPLYELEGVPGLWHEACLRAAHS